jgi:hypothetical protein
MNRRRADRLSPAFERAGRFGRGTGASGLLQRTRALTWLIAVPYKPRDFAGGGGRAVRRSISGGGVRSGPRRRAVPRNPEIVS